MAKQDAVTHCANLGIESIAPKQPELMQSDFNPTFHRENPPEIFFYNFFYFPTVQQGGQVILTCIHYNYIFPPPFVLLQHEYLDKVLNATHQDLLVKLF